MKSALLLILHCLVVGSYSYSHNQYRRQIDMNLNRPELESAIANDRYTIHTSAPNSTDDSVAPTRLHNKILPGATDTIEKNITGTNVSDSSPRTVKYIVAEIKASFEEKNDSLLNNPKIVYTVKNNKDYYASKGDINEMVNNYDKKEASVKESKNSAEKSLDDIDDSEDFEYQLSRFFAYPKTQDSLSEKDKVDEVTASNTEDVNAFADLAFDIHPDDKDRIKRKSESDSKYRFNVKPEEDGNEGESTSTETSSMTSLNDLEIDSIKEEKVDSKEDPADQKKPGNIADVASSNILKKLTSFLLSFYTRIRDIIAKILKTFTNRSN